MCGVVDTDKENEDKDKGKHNITKRLSFVTFIIWNIPEQKYFVKEKELNSIDS